MFFISKSEKETEEFASSLARRYKNDATFLLYGDLGAGKTAFTRGLAKGYGSYDRVSSPTFTLVHEYKGDVKIYHFDLYRINDADELEDMGFYEYFHKGSVRVIEWPDAFGDVMPEDSVKVYIKYKDGNEREFKIIERNSADENTCD